jgi:hypothetical protein
MPTEPAAPTEKRRIHHVEPELQQPVPRHVGPTKGLQFVRWLALAGAVLATAFVLLGKVHAGTHADPTGLFVVIFGYLPLLILPIMELVYRSQAKLARTGVATVGVMQAPPGFGVGDALQILGALAARRGAARSERIKYRYRVASGDWREETTRVNSHALGPWSRAGESVTVLYDPANPKRHALYPMLAKGVRMLPPSAPKAEA